MILNVVGMDPSLTHWGIATGTYDTVEKTLRVQHIAVTTPVKSSSKQVRQNSKDLDCAMQLARSAMEACTGDVQAIFVEVPHGSQSARAMASYGICIGVLGSLRAQGVGLYEQTPTEVKLASHGTKTATKQQMIDWAMQAHPEAPWPLRTQKGVTSVITSQAEHMADAIATIHAGLNDPQFQRLLPLLKTTQPKENQ